MTSAYERWIMTGLPEDETPPGEGDPANHPDPKAEQVIAALLHRKCIAVTESGAYQLAQQILAALDGAGYELATSPTPPKE